MATSATTSFMRLLEELAKCNALTARDFSRIAASSEPFNPDDLDPTLTIQRRRAYKAAFSTILASGQLDWRSVRTKASQLVNERVDQDVVRCEVADRTQSLFVALKPVVARRGRPIDSAVVYGPSLSCCVALMLRDDRTRYLTAVSLTGDTTQWPTVEIPRSSSPRVPLATYSDGCIWVPVLDSDTGAWSVVDAVSGNQLVLQDIPSWAEPVQFVSVPDRGLQFVVGTRRQRHDAHLNAIVFVGLDEQPEDQRCQRVPLARTDVERVRGLISSTDGEVVAIAETSTELILFQVFGPSPPRA